MGELVLQKYLTSSSSKASLSSSLTILLLLFQSSFFLANAFVNPSQQRHKHDVFQTTTSPFKTTVKTSSNCPDQSTTTLNGIPKMFRWLTDQYPTINRQLNEGLTYNTVVDNFYLDMNGIIHPCTHGNSDSVVILDETEMFKKIFGYVDRLYKLVRPRNVLYLAVDGVAPRAKMNQQRSRRFRSAKEAEMQLADYLATHGTLPDDSSRFDSNCITPGTDFMLKLGALHHYYF